MEDLELSQHTAASKGTHLKYIQKAQLHLHAAN
jgi:hypothetical protein